MPGSMQVSSSPEPAGDGRPWGGRGYSGPRPHRSRYAGQCSREELTWVSRRPSARLAACQNCATRGANPGATCMTPSRVHEIARALRIRDTRWGVLLASITVALSLHAAAPTGSPTPRCDEACLKDFMERYLRALVRHDPASLPMAQQYRYTENGAQLA